ncbi:MAG: ABC transporter ATP-binding protein, partial [Chloroflexota bacterium]
MATTTSTNTVSPAEFSIERTWQSDRRGPARWIFSHAKRSWIYLVGVVVGAFGNGLGAGLVPIYIGQAFNLIQSKGEISGLIGISVSLVVSQAIRAVLMGIRNMSSEIVGQRVERDTRDELYLNLIGKSMSFHDRTQTGELMARATNDVHELNFLFNPGVNIAIGSFNFMVAPFILTPAIHPQLLLVPTIYVILYLIALWDYLRSLRPATEGVRREFGNLNANLAEAVDGIETVKGAAQEQKEMTRFDQALKHWRNAYVQQGDVEAKFFPLLLFGLLQALGLLHALLLYRQGLIT